MGTNQYGGMDVYALKEIYFRTVYGPNVETTH
jgi:hypothetical protein